MLRKFKTIIHLKSSERHLALVAIVVLSAVKMALWLCPFHRLVSVVSLLTKARRGSTIYDPKLIAWAVLLASRHVPHKKCLCEALTAHILLTHYRHASCLRIGVAATPEFEAHAWTEYNGAVLVGDQKNLGRFTKILSIPSANQQTMKREQ